MTEFFDDKLIPWYKYANSANGICNKYVEKDFSDIPVTGNIEFSATGLDYSFTCGKLYGYEDSDGNLCGEVTCTFENTN